MKPHEVSLLRKHHIRGIIDNIRDEVNDLIMKIKYKCDKLIQFIIIRIEGDVIPDDELHSAYREMLIQEKSVQNDRETLNERLHQISALDSLVDMLPEI